MCLSEYKVSFGAHQGNRKTRFSIRGKRDGHYLSQGNKVIDTVSGDKARSLCGSFYKFRPNAFISV